MAPLNHQVDCHYPTRLDRHCLARGRLMLRPGAGKAKGGPQGGWKTKDEILGESSATRN